MHPILLLAVWLLASGFTWEIQGYAGLPFHQSYSNVVGTGANGANWYNDLKLQDNPIVGAGVATWLTPTIGLRAEAFQFMPSIEAQPLRITRMSGVPIQSEWTTSRGYRQQVLGVAPSVAFRYPIDAWHLSSYMGFGPAFLRHKQCDSFGCTPPGLTMGLHTYAGVNWALTDRLHLFGEVKFLFSEFRYPDEPQGAFAGTYTGTFGVVGVGWQFGD